MSDNLVSCIATNHGPGPFAAILLFYLVPPLHDANEVIPRSEVFLPGNPKDPEPMLVQKREFGRLRANPPVAGDHDKTTSGDGWDPVRIESAVWNLRNQRVARMDYVASSDRKRFAKAQHALVGEESEACRIRRHRKVRPRCRCESAHTAKPPRRSAVGDRRSRQSRRSAHQRASARR